MARSLDHPNVLSIIEIFEGDQSFYMIMDLLEGDTLYSYSKRNDISISDLIVIMKVALKLILLAIQ